MVQLSPFALWNFLEIASGPVSFCLRNPHYSKGPLFERLTFIEPGDPLAPATSIQAVYNRLEYRNPQLGGLARSRIVYAQV